MNEEPKACLKPVRAVAVRREKENLADGPRINGEEPAGRKETGDPPPTKARRPQNSNGAQEVSDAKKGATAAADDGGVNVGWERPKERRRRTVTSRKGSGRQLRGCAVHGEGTGNGLAQPGPFTKSQETVYDLLHASTARATDDHHHPLPNTAGGPHLFKHSGAPMDPKEHSGSKAPLLDLAAAAAAERPTHAGVRGPGRQARADDGCESGRRTGRETTRDGAATSAGCQGSANGRLGKGGESTDVGYLRRRRPSKNQKYPPPPPPTSPPPPTIPLAFRSGTTERAVVVRSRAARPSCSEHFFLFTWIPREGRTLKRDATREKQSAPPTSAAQEGNRMSRQEAFGFPGWTAVERWMNPVTANELRISSCGMLETGQPLERPRDARPVLSRTSPSRLVY
ncbi:hypothetical protein HPB50_026132 [Hyalomma asiaticum]|uniref:Uncharacterized protein n=1 Tax=Hyalomma asiaticum TaxID=266040 RepID=A0ACB7SD39_HYAAI|nr:hypothetical protein HPB50_026132 [Hyalomma asiaticum]